MADPYQILSASDGGGGTVALTAAAHSLAVGEPIMITGSTDYNGVFSVVASTDVDTFTITDTYTTTQTGTWARAAYTKDLPSGDTFMSGSTEFIRANWEILEDWWLTDHGALSAATSGAHSIGEVGVLLTGNTATIAALSAPGTGALALDTELGEMQLHRYLSATSGYGWEGITDNKFSRLRVGFGAQAIPATAWTQLTTTTTGTSGTYDGISEWAAAKFTAQGPGYYLVEATIIWPTGVTSEYGKSIALAKNGSSICVRTVYGAGAISVWIADTITLTAGEYVQIKVYHNNTASLTINGGVLHITRVS